MDKNKLRLILKIIKMLIEVFESELEERKRNDQLEDDNSENNFNGSRDSNRFLH